MHAAALECSLQSRDQAIGRGDTGALRAIALGVFHEVRIAEGETEVREFIHRLLPADHAIGGVLQDQDHEVELQPDRRLHLLRIHHEAAVAAHRHHPPVRIEDRGHHRRRQACAHGGERIVQQHRVGNVGPVVPREPDLVHPIVEGDDSVLGHDLPNVVDDPLRGRREARFRVAIGNPAQNALAQRQQRAGVWQPRLDAVSQQFEARPDVAHDLALREIDLLDGCRRVADVNDLRPSGPHDEGRLLDGVMADGDNEIGLVHRLVNIVAFAQCRRSHVEIAAARGRPLPHLGREERDPCAPDEAVDPRGAAWPGGGGAEHDQRTLRGKDHFHGPIERNAVGDGNFDRVRRHHDGRFGLFAGDVLRQFQQHRPRSFLRGNPEGIAHQGRDRRGANDLPRHLGQRLERGHDIDDLESGLAARHDSLLSRDHHHRHGTEQRIGRARGEIQRARPQCGQAHPRLAGEPAVGCGHERCALFMPGHDQLDGRLAQALDHVEIFLAGNAEDAVDAFVLQRGDHQVRSLGHSHTPELLPAINPWRPAVMVTSPCRRHINISGRLAASQHRARNEE